MKPYFCVRISEIRRTCGSREGLNVPDVADAGDVHYKTLESEAEAGVLCPTVAAEIDVPAVIVLVKTELLYALKKHVKTLLSLRAAHKLPDSGDKEIDRRNRLSVVVDPHIERLDVARASR